MNEQLNQNSWHQHDFYAMGSQMSVWLECDDADVATVALTQVEALFAAAERRLTRFSATSELSKLNAQAGQWVPVSNVLWQVLTWALALAEQTAGRFDPTLLTALTAAGYDRSFAMLEPAALSSSGDSRSAIHTMDRQNVSPNVGQWQNIELDATQHAIRTPPSLQFDLGGIGKGYTAQQAIQFLRHWGPCLVDAGGDLVAGDAPSAMPGWPVAIAAPTTTNSDSAHDLAQLWLKNAALATSGIDYRRWQQDGRPMHHIIDPQSGQPASSDLLTVSVLAADATTAEAWAKALLLVGHSAATDEMNRRGLAAALVGQTEDLTLSTTIAPFVGA